MKILLLGLVIILSFQSKLFSEENTIWLSGTPPKDVAKGIRPTGMQKLSSFRTKRGKEKLILWIRSGESPINSKYLNKTITNDPGIFLYSQSGNPIECDLSTGDKGFALTYDWGEEGFYNIYIVEKFVRNDTLFIIVAKAERLHHKCRDGHKGIRKKLPPKCFSEKIPFEIIRNRIPREDFHTCLESGFDVTYKVLLNNKPVEGSVMKMITRNDWQKVISSNEKGEVTFRLIGDHFSKLEELESEKIYHFLLKAVYYESQSGKFNNKDYKHIHYTCTMEGDYLPSQTLYKSYIWPLVILIFFIVSLSALVYFYRLRKRRMY